MGSNPFPAGTVSRDCTQPQPGYWLARPLGTSPLTNGARITIGVENIGNSRQTVRNQAGTTPLGYQSIYRDPLGRMVSIELRKVF